MLCSCACTRAATSSAVVPFEDGHAGLQDHRAPVQLFGDEVDAGAVFTVTGIYGALVGVQALILGQQGGVDIDHPARRNGAPDRRSISA